MGTVRKGKPIDWMTRRLTEKIVYAMFVLSLR